jgi:hypothetical protein
MAVRPAPPAARFTPGRLRYPASTTLRAFGGQNHARVVGAGTIAAPGRHCVGRRQRDHFGVAMRRFLTVAGVEKEELSSHFLRWAKNPKVREQICENWLRPEEKERRMREVFGSGPKEEIKDAVKHIPTRQRPVKPN